MQTQDKLGSMPIGKLLAVMSLPMMISMLVQALYNTVDAMFVAKLSEDALTAVSLAYPFQIFDEIPTEEYDEKADEIIVKPA